MALGTNLNGHGPQYKLWALFQKALLNKKFASRHTVHGPSIVSKNGAPATNTAGDNPTRKGVVIINEANGDAYICTAYTNSTTFTIVKLN